VGRVQTAAGCFCFGFCCCFGFVWWFCFCFFVFWRVHFWGVIGHLFVSACLRVPRGKGCGFVFFGGSFFLFLFLFFFGLVVLFFLLVLFWGGVLVLASRRGACVFFVCWCLLPRGGGLVLGCCGVFFVWWCFVLCWFCVLGAGFGFTAWGGSKAGFRPITQPVRAGAR
jgi:hypothetical protein